MFTKNWYKILASGLMGSYKSTIFQSGAVDYKGVSRNLCCYSNERLYNFINIRSYITSVQTINPTTMPANNYGVWFGDGTVSPTLDDFNLSGNHISTISASNVPSVTGDDAGGILSITYTLTNTGSADVTIGEVGLFNFWYYTTSSYTAFLVDRTVLDTPVTIPAGGIGQVTYTIRMNYPTV